MRGVCIVKTVLYLNYEQLYFCLKYAWAKPGYSASIMRLLFQHH